MIIKKAYVVGDNTKKSLSPIIFKHWFKKHNVDGKYFSLQTSKKLFDKKLKLTLKQKSLCGLNVTIPFKEKIIPYLDKIDTHAKKIGAVNCVVKKGGKLYGFNTDWVGFKNSVKKKFKKESKNNTAIVIGYGGAAKAIIYSLKLLGYKKIKVFNRTYSKMNKIKNQKSIFCYNLNNVFKHIYSADIIVNTIPTNIFKNQRKKEDFKYKKNLIVCDIVYLPKETQFLKSFKKTQNKVYGISMLLEQAAPCFKMWFGVSPCVNKFAIKNAYRKNK